MSRGPRPPAGCRLVQSTAKPRLGKLRGRLKGFLESLREPSQPACAQGSLACGLRVLEREPARLAQPRRAGGTSTLASQGGAGGPPCPLRRSRRHHRAQGTSRPRDRPPFASLPCSASRAAPATQRSVPTALPRPLAAPGCPALLAHSGRRLRTCTRGRTAVFSLRCRSSGHWARDTEVPKDKITEKQQVRPPCSGPWAGRPEHFGSKPTNRHLLFRLRGAGKGRPRL